MVEEIKIKEGFQKTDVGVIPDDWTVLDLGSFTDLLTGFPFPSAKFAESGIRLLRGSNIKRGNTDWSNDITKFWQSISFDLKKYVLKDKDIVIAMDGSLVGKSFAQLTKNDLPALLLQRVARLRTEKADINYLKQFVCSSIFTLHCESVKTASAIPHISPKNIKDFKIPLPPTITEQTAIATALSNMDSLIEGLEKLLVKKRNIKQGAMQELLTPKEGWEEKTLKEIALFRRGSFPQPYGLPKWYDDEKGMPFIQVYDVAGNMKLKETTKQKISDLAKSRSVFVEKGTVILTIQGSIGRIAITQYDSYLDRTLLIFTTYLIPMNKVFFMFMVYQLFQIEKQKAPGGTIKTITKDKLSEFKLHYPTLDEQKKIACILSDMSTEIEQLETQLSKYKMLKTGMMQQLLTGKKRLV